MAMGAMERFDVVHFLQSRLLCMCLDLHVLKNWVYDVSGPTSFENGIVCLLSERILL